MEVPGDGPPPVFQALAGRADLAAYGANAILLFALELHLRIEDILAVAASALTDGSDDKKCDLVYVDRDLGKAVVAQSYYSQDDTTAAAPANKASDLNTAVTWLLGRNLAALPDRIRPAAQELDEALAEGVITSIDIWYVHNLPESKNVRDELDRVQDTASALLRAKYPDVEIDSVTTIEVGRERLDEWYRSSLVAILVSDEFRLPITGGFKESGDRWEAYSTSVQISWLRDLFNKYKTALFSANVRDYLGSRRSDRNINFNIKETARAQPRRFWAYNNGLTALVNDYHFEEDGEVLVIEGISIVNGAQTTGALGSVEIADAEEFAAGRVPARFVKCSDQEVVRDIIRNNNSQNRIEASDYRSGDAIQERLRTEFDLVPDAEYRGGRRGGELDLIERTPNLVPSGTAAQSLLAFHQDPNTAYNEKSRIWSEDNIYSKVFSDKTSARHVVLTYALERAIEEAKRRLLAVSEADRTQLQVRQVEFFRQRGSILLLVAAIGASIETYLGRAVPDRFSLRFRDNISPHVAAELWRPIVESALSFVERLEPALERTLKNKERVTEAVDIFGSLVSATRQANAAIFDPFAEAVVN